MAKRSWTRVGLPVLLAATSFVVPGAARAAEGRIPLFGPGVISQSGKYVLTRDISGPGGTPALSIQAPQVDIDLNGFMVTNSNGDDCIQVATPSVRLAVRNGTLTACQSGVDASSATQVIVEDVTVYGPSGPGINLSQVGSIAIRRVNVLGAGADAIGIYSPEVSHNALVEDCMIKDSVGGIVFNGGTVQIRGNRVTTGGGSGISVVEANASDISGNLLIGAAESGIKLTATHGTTVVGNVVRFANQHGIWLTATASNNLVRDNVATSNGPGGSGHGLFVQGTSNKVEGNTLNNNGGVGLFFDVAGCGNTFGRNMARGNTGSGVGACSALFVPNSCSQCNSGPDNASFGDNLIPGPSVF